MVQFGIGAAIGFGSLVLTGAIAIYDFFAEQKEGLHAQKQKQQTQTKKKICKILLTGGPCGGKSQGINYTYLALKFINAPVFVVPQAATIIGTSGLSLNIGSLAPRNIQLFQIYLLRLQYNLESIVINIAKGLGHKHKSPVVLCDRGLLDGKAYAGQQNFSKMLKDIELTEKQILHRYEAVIHMVTAAHGAEQWYGTNKVRAEDMDFARSLDKKIIQCYKDHPKRYVIANDFFVKSFQVKKVILLAKVSQILQEILQFYSLEQYYAMAEDIRKNSQEETGLVPYIIRKRKAQKFINRA